MRLSIIAGITKEFIKDRAKDFYRKVFKPNKYFTVIEVDNGNGDDKYYYAQRAGKDSVAFVLFDANREDSFGLLKQYSASYNNFMIKAFTGSLNDKQKVESYKDLLQYVQEEVDEESDFTVTQDNISFIKKIPTCTVSCDEYVYLFLVDVTNAKKTDTKPENEYEENTEQPWFTKEEIIKNIDDPKALIITLLKN